MAAGGGETVAILNRNEPSFHLVPAAAYAAMLNYALADARMNSPEVTVSLNDV
ncbi:MAG: hypothetical protein Q4G26_05700 [Paracoccus sp. (in: a-proteobacteria)]|nr:hypothetical protein [Paracoccus sp. (in: a-proteobacteria)]